MNVIYGSKTGLSAHDAIFYQSYNGTAGKAEAYDKFGTSLASGDVDGDGFDELVVGTPHEDHSGRTNAGQLSVIYGSKSGLTKKDSTVSQALSKITGVAEKHDYFAHDVAMADFDADGKADIAAVVSGENFGSDKTPTATNVIYGTRSSIRSARNSLLVYGQKQAGFSLSGKDDDGETDPVYQPTEVTGSWLTASDETIQVDRPTEVTGSWLIDVDPRAVSIKGSRDGRAFSYNDIVQREAASCVFSASLSAVARTRFDFASHIKYVGTDGTGYKYKVKLYDYKSLKPEWVTVSYNGATTALDMGQADGGEFWTVLYQRAYAKKYNFKLSEMEHPKNSAYLKSTTALPTITGKKAEFTRFKTSSLLPTSTNRVLAQNALAGALKNGKAVIAVTSTSKNLKSAIEKAGLVDSHGYTVVAIKNAGKSNATVTLRNPWGEDGPKSRDGSNDGIVRISWKDFERLFQKGFRTSAV